jgi:hypothetical protein
VGNGAETCRLFGGLDGEMDRCARRNGADHRDESGNLIPEKRAIRDAPEGRNPDPWEGAGSFGGELGNLGSVCTAKGRESEGSFPFSGDLDARFKLFDVDGIANSHLQRHA